MRTFTLLGSLLIAGALVGCAHPMVIAPDTSGLQVVSGDQKINKKVGYYLADDKRILEVTTPGGGGDKVTYKPYADTETAVYQMLGSVFSGVTVLKSSDDAAAIEKNGLSYVISPQLVTDSSSSSALTWPPTAFTVEMTCMITDAKGAPVASPMVKGEGKAEFSEFKSDFSLSGKRAAQDAILKMQAALLAAPELRK